MASAGDRFDDAELAELKGSWIFQLGLWLLLGIALFVVKENRTLPVFVVLIPLAVVLALGILMQNTLPKDLLGTVNLAQIFICLGVGFTMMLLMGETLAKGNRFSTLLVAFAILLAAGAVGIYGSNDGRLDAADTLAVQSYGIWALALLVGLFISIRLGHGGYSNKRLLLLLLPILMLLQILGVVFIIALFMGSLGEALTIVSGMGFWIIVVGIVMGIVLYLAVLPFLILIAKNSVFDRRFKNWLALPAPG